jgi:hypothetical protein
MGREVREITISEYCNQWHGNSPTTQVFKAWWNAENEVVECEKLDQKNKYRIKLSNGEYRVIDSHVQIFLELY